MSHRLLKGEMKLIRSALWSAKAVLSRRSHVIRSFSANPFSVPDDWDKMNSSGPVGESEQKNSNARIFSSSHSFYQELDKAEKAHDQSGLGSSFNAGNRSNNNGLYESYNPLADDLNYKLQKAASYFEFDPKEVISDTYSFRPDVNFMSGMTYDPKDLDLRRPGVRRPVKRYAFETTTEEVLLKADFRNVKFLANFITEAGVIIKRSKTGISAKAQRKIAREIKTARAFGLMPFTTMGTKQFVYGATMEDEDRDFEFATSTSYDHNFVDDDVGNAA